MVVAILSLVLTAEAMTVGGTARQGMDFWTEVSGLQQVISEQVRLSRHINATQTTADEEQ